MKKKIGVFIDHDLFVRNFLNNKIFSSLHKLYEVIYFFPEEKNRPGDRRRINKKILDKIKVKKKIIVNVDFKRNIFVKYLFRISSLFFSRYKKDKDKEQFIKFHENAINSRTVFAILRLISSYPIYYLTVYLFKKLILGKNIHLEKIIKKFQIDLILSPTTWGGYFDMDLIDIGKKFEIPTIFLMNSWDNTNFSGMPHENPNRYLVWGKKSKNYANEFKKIPLQNLDIIGSAQFSIKKQKKIEYKKLINLKKKDNFIVYAGSNMGIDEGYHLKLIDEHIIKKKRPYKIIYRPHPWKVKAKNEKHIKAYNFKNVILDPFSKKNYDNIFFKNKNFNKTIANSNSHESYLIIESSVGLFGPVGTLCLEACWNKKPVATYLPSDRNEIRHLFKTLVDAKHIQDFIKDLKIPLCKNSSQIVNKIDYIYKRKNSKKYLSYIKKKSKNFLDYDLNYKEILLKNIRKVLSQK